MGQAFIPCASVASAKERSAPLCLAADPAEPHAQPSATSSSTTLLVGAISRTTRATALLLHSPNSNASFYRSQISTLSRSHLFNIGRLGGEVMGFIGEDALSGDDLTT